MAQRLHPLPQKTLQRRNMFDRLILALVGVAALGSAHAASVDAYEPHDGIRAAAETYALALADGIAPGGARVEASAAALDPRLRLAACPTALETFSPPGHRAGARTTVGVRCSAAAAWSLYVPVNIAITADVVVLTAPAGRGHVLSAADVALEPRNVAQLAAPYLTEIDTAAGMVLRRPVRPGTVLTAALLEPPRLLRRGDRVRIRAGGGPVAVDSEGEALADAAAGERVRVRNLRSGTIVEGFVDEAGYVVAGR